MVWSEYDPCYDLPKYDGTSRTYLIATTQRTGSHLLAHLLGMRGDIGVPFEYLNDYRSSLELTRRRQPNTELAQLALLLEMRARRTGSSGWFGIKAHWHTWSAVLSKPLLAAQIQPDVIIYVIRRDRVAQAASLVIAEQTGWWVDESQSTSVTPVYSAVRMQEALDKINRENSAWETYLSCLPGCLTLTYEALVMQSETTISAVYDALGVQYSCRSTAGFPMPKPRTDDLVRQWALRFLDEDHCT